MRIRIRLITLMRIRILMFIKLFDLDADADPDPTFHPDAVGSQTGYSFQIRLKALKKCSNRRIFHTFRIVICKLIRIRFWV
jgi:hypothetical protein